MPRPKIFSIRRLKSSRVVASESGNPAEAERIQRSLVEIERRVFGPEHPETLMGTSNLANYISDQGRYAEYEPLYRQTLAIQTRLLAVPILTPCRPWITWPTLSELKRRAEAEMLLREILATRLQEFGAHNPETANTAYNLACMLALDNRREEAITYLRQSLDYGLPVRMGLAIEKDEDLKFLRGEPRFKSIVELAKQRAQAEQGSQKN